ncbi:MAG: hypothetical protein ACRDL2_06310 [Gaiellaceae bacterium]
MIVSLHVALGGLTGAGLRSRALALLAGPVLHVACDRVPHEDIPSRRFEIGSGLACLALLAARRGPLDAAVLGAAASSAPDLEHVVPRLRAHGQKLFHRRAQHGGGLPADVQLLVAGAILGALLGAPRSG